MNPKSPLVTAAAISRRRFIQNSTGAAVALSALPIARFAHAAEGGPLKLALVGCGGRGSGAANQALKSGHNVRLVAVAELFKEKADTAIKNLQTQHSSNVDVPEERIFIGFEGYKQAIAACDVVILATPCTFRPQMFEEAVKQGKHAFMEKPVALDAPGVRRVLEAAKIAKEKGLKVGVGLQRRHKPGYLEAVKRVQDGALGQIMYCRSFWDMGAARAMLPRKPEWNELEFQLHNQFYFAWQCGDIIVDQGLHNIDVVNWFHGDKTPISAKGVAGAEVRKGPGAGALFDHFAIEFEYADGSRSFHQNRQIPGCWNSVSEHAHGTLGSLDCLNDRNIFAISGKNEWRYTPEQPLVDPYQQEHNDLFAAIVKNEAYSEAERGAMNTMTAIMGRMAGYSGQLILWEDAFKSEKRLAPDITSLQDEPPVKPDEDGVYPLPIPGKSEPV